MTPEEIIQWVNDAKRRSFENGWKATVKATVEWLKELRELRDNSEHPIIEQPKKYDKVKITRNIHLDSQTQSSMGDIEI